MFTRYEREVWLYRFFFQTIIVSLIAVLMVE